MEIMCGRVRSCHRQARQLVIPDRQVTVLLQARPGTATAEEGQARQVITSELQADIQLVDHIEDTGMTGVDAPEASSIWLLQLQPVPVSVQDGPFNRDGTAGSPRQCLHGG